MSLHLLPIDDLVASTLVADAWQGALLTLAAALALRLLPRISAAGRFCAWAALFVILMLLPFVQRPHATATGSGIHVASWWSVVVALLWASVSLLRAAQLAHAFLLLRTFSRRARPLLTLPPSAARSAPLCLSSDVSRPSVVGFFRPKILIPDALYARLPPAELEHILLHEQQHLQRRDDWLNLLQKIGLVLFPLNPALLWVERRLCLERELACDESVLAHTGAPESYARSLVSLAEHALLGRQFSLALGAWGHRSELTRRVHRILAGHTPALSPRLATTALALLCTGLAGAAVALSRSPRLISFTQRAQPAYVTATNTIAQRRSQPVHLELTSSVEPTHFASPKLTFEPAVMHAGPRISAAARRGRPKEVLHKLAAPHTLLASYAIPTDVRLYATKPQPVALESIALQNWEHTTQSGAELPNRLRPSFRVRALQATNPQSGQKNSSAFVLTVFTSFTASPAYATVRVPNGWIVIQL